MLDVKIPIQKTTQSRLPQVDFNDIQFGKIYADHMLVADCIDGVWQECRIEPFANMPLSPATSALHYGQAIFEGMKAYRKADGNIAIFRPDENFKRFNASAERICMPPVPEHIFLEGLAELIRLDRDWVPDRPGCALYIRPFMFATDEYIGLRPSGNYRFIIFNSPVGAYYSEPVRVKIETHFTRAAAGGTGFAKTAGNYAASLYPAKLAQQQGYHQLIWTDAKEHAYIEEAGTMNVMFVIGDTLRTPPTGDSILPGITRKSVLQLARDWGMKVEEAPVPVAEVVAAAKNGTLKEAFGAGTAATIAQIALIAYEGVDYQLPPVAEREFSNKVYAALEDIKHGRLPDPHGWLYTV